MTDNKFDSQISFWLRETEAGSNPYQFLGILDTLFAEGPVTEITLQAQANLEKTLTRIKKDLVYYDVITHALVGAIFVAKNERGVFAVNFGTTEEEFVKVLEHGSDLIAIRSPEKTFKERRQLREYLNGERTHFDINVDLSTLTDFHRQVLLTTWKIPHGKITTYGEIARRLGKPKAARAVGQALGRNPVPIVIPCHRVIASDGSLGGYSGRGGLETKANLLALENSALLLTNQVNELGYAHRRTPFEHKP